MDPKAAAQKEPAADDVEAECSASEGEDDEADLAKLQQQQSVLVGSHELPFSDY